MTLVRAIYSASAVDSAINGCLRADQATGPPFNRTTYPDIEWRCSCDAQSASTNASSPPSVEPKVSSKSAVPFR
ncbi:hypothetical protein CY34DRAFT_101718 [Suillus luteus UH-Slu-Lm8-n1]|uniref:Uncharacterized protein n=1 Tax=Suillus luteus UH-Slu-Lm8-n1 TaxID=930992 RepID=A0A0D0AK68_9AGAM|nr:hypothetical protein CY34DRAFT_101718 [Suillus luteus UH-Slu-Lm8-n1]